MAATAAAVLAAALLAACGDGKAEQQVASISAEHDARVMGLGDDAASTTTEPPLDVAGTAAGGGASAAGQPAAPAPAPATTAPAAPQTPTERAVAAVSGKGQYLYKMDELTQRYGSIQGLVNAAKAAGLRHLILRSGNPVDGFYVRPVLDQLLPAAHAAGIKVVAYDGPAMEDPRGDAARAKAMVDYTAPSGDKVDAFAADMESSRAPNLDAAHASAYAKALNAAIGDDYPKIAIVVNPNYHAKEYPFDQLVPAFHVVSPMDYWSGVTNDGAAFIRTSMDMLKKYNKPISVIGQAYPIEGKGTYPNATQFAAQMQAAKDGGAVGISFWAWDYTRDDSWKVITDFGW